MVKQRKKRYLVDALDRNLNFLFQTLFKKNIQEKTFNKNWIIHQQYQRQNSNCLKAVVKAWVSVTASINTKAPAELKKVVAPEFFFQI